MEKITILLLAILGLALGGNLKHAPAPQLAYAAAPAPQLAYAKVHAHASEARVASAPQQYSQEIPAAAIRNIETVDVTKTITPVITKTRTHHTRSEPALAVGHVQGYRQSAHGPAKVAKVHYNTQYTQYLNPTVGVNGPVTYSGPAVGQGVALQQGIAVQPAAPVAVQPQPVYATHQAHAHHHAQPAYVAHAGLHGGFLNAGFRHGGLGLHAHNHGYQAAYAAPAIGVTAFNTHSLLTSAGYGGGHHSFHGF